MQHLLDGNSWSELRFGEAVVEQRFGLVVLGRCGWEGRVACRNDVFPDFAGPVGGGVGDAVTVVVGDEGVGDVAEVALGVDGYCYWQATAVAKQPVVAGHIAVGVRLRLQHGRSGWIE